MANYSKTATLDGPSVQSTHVPRLGPEVARLWDDICFLSFLTKSVSLHRVRVSIREMHVLKESAISCFFQRSDRFLKESVTSKVISGIAPSLRKVKPAFSEIAVFASFML